MTLKTWLITAAKIFAPTVQLPIKKKENCNELD